VLVWRRGGYGVVGQVLVVEDGVEDQGVSADGFAAIDGVVGEEKHVALAQVGVDDDGVLGDGGSFVEKAVEEKGCRMAGSGTRTTFRLNR